MTTTSDRKSNLITGLVLLAVIGGFVAWQVLKDQNGPPLVSDEQIHAAISGSDGIDRHRVAFDAAAHELVTRGRCSLATLTEIGGWVEMGSTSPARGDLSFNDEGYFVQCGDTNADRWYVEVHRNGDDAWYRLFQ